MRPFQRLRRRNNGERPPAVSGGGKGLQVALTLEDVGDGLQKIGHCAGHAPGPHRLGNHVGLAAVPGGRGEGLHVGLAVIWYLEVGGRASMWVWL